MRSVVCETRSMWDAQCVGRAVFGTRSVWHAQCVGSAELGRRRVWEVLSVRETYDLNYDINFFNLR